MVALCAISAFFLLPIFIWHHLRFSTHPSSLSQGEVGAVLAYIAFFGWLLPLGSACGFILSLFTHTTTASVHKDQARAAQPEAEVAGSLNPPRYQPGVLSPFVFAEDIPWGWLEYCSGNFMGQRLAMKRVIITLGRDENCDIWLDDEVASRLHAEIAWDQGRICLTDCESLNGVSLNGKRIQGTVQLHSHDEIAAGTQRFVFVLADRKRIEEDLDDPLAHHTWRSTNDLQAELSTESRPVPGVSQPMGCIETTGLLPEEGSSSTTSGAFRAASTTPSSSMKMSGPMPLRLPSRPKQTEK